MDDGLRERLKDRQAKAGLRSPEMREALHAAAAKIRRRAGQGSPTEATVASAVEIELHDLLCALGRDVAFDKERLPDAERRLARGRIDSSVGSLVIEFKRPAALRTDAQVEAGTRQLVGYLRPLCEREPDADFLGVLTDGLRVRFVPARGAQADPEPVEEMGARSLRRIVEAALALETRALNAANLVREFCEPDGEGLSIALARALHRALRERPTSRTRGLHAEWERLFKLGHEDKSHQRKIRERADALGRLLGAKVRTAPEQYDALFALQTTYAILVKLIAYRTLTDVVHGTPLLRFASLAKADDDALRAFLQDFEAGTHLRGRHQIENLLEGDLFSWYVDEAQWDAPIAAAVRECVGRLAPYESKSGVFHRETVGDLFRDLYQSVMPKEVRHSLGEYYTPRWLAEQVVAEAATAPGWRGLDPCCGSGTFVHAMIDRIVRETRGRPDAEVLAAILARARGVDLNPLAVLTARVNYFIAISPYLPDDPPPIEIPIHLGDSANLPRTVLVGGVPCFAVAVGPGDVEVVLPEAAARHAGFAAAMAAVEARLRKGDVASAADALARLLPAGARSPEARSAVEEAVGSLAKLEGSDGAGVWTRVVKNAMRVAALGRHEAIVGNPPWIDWKNLPAGYRDRLKQVCVRRDIFSGDRITGGINLNVCALITSVVAERWLADDGRLAFLMPKFLLFQQTYTGWRRLPMQERPPLRFQRLHDWSRAGDPFHPVTQKFLTYFLGFGEPAGASVPVTAFRRRKGADVKGAQAEAWAEVRGRLDEDLLVAGQLSSKHNAFTFARDDGELARFRRVAGACHYRGRVGVEFYPQELMLFTHNDAARPKRKGLAWITNYQGADSSYSVPEDTVQVETRFLHPLLRGVEIQPFRSEPPRYLVPFPYRDLQRDALSEDDLERESPLLRAHLERHRAVFEKQTDYNRRIQGKHNNVYYSLARVGRYTYAPFKVAYRDNTRWCAAVVSTAPTPWGEEKPRLCQNHAAYVGESGDGAFLTEDEAHYVCAIMNAPTAARFVHASSDTRTFKVHPPFHLPRFDPADELHRRLAALSKRAHARPDRADEVLQQIDEAYLSLCGRKARAGASRAGRESP